MNDMVEFWCTLSNYNLSAVTANPTTAKHTLTLELALTSFKLPHA